MPGRLEPVAMKKVKKDFPNEFILYLCSGRFLHSTDGKTSRSTSRTEHLSIFYFYFPVHCSCLLHIDSIGLDIPLK